MMPFFISLGCGGFGGEFGDGLEDEVLDLDAESLLLAIVSRDTCIF